MVSRLHLQRETCTNGHGKTASMIPLIILVSGEFSSPGVGSGAASLAAGRCWQNETHCRKEICSTCLFEDPFPLFLLGIPSIHCLAEAGFLRFYAFVEDSVVFHGHGVGVSKVFFPICHVEYCDVSRLSFWKWGCRPFSCPCSQNVTLAQGYFFDILV